MKRSNFLVRASTGAALAALSKHGSAAPGVSGDTILLGQSVALSGPLGQLGKEYRDGAELWFDQINQQGGLFGRKVKFLSLDDGGEVPRAVANTKQLVNDKGVFAIFGQFGTGATRETLSLTAQKGVPVIAPYSGADALRETSEPYLFHVRASYGRELHQIVDHLSTIGIQRVGIVYQEDGFGQAALRGAQAALAKVQNQPVVTASITVSPKVDVSQAVSAVSNKQPAAIILCVSGEGAVAFLSQYAKTGMSAQFYGLSEISSRELISELGESARGIVITQVVPSPWSTVTRISLEYQRLRRLKWLSPGYASMEGFIAAKVMVQGLKRAGKNLTRERPVAELEGIADLDLGGFRVSYGRGNRSGSTFVDLSMVTTNGEFFR
jgi:branched-chain amino acid transport system substrate-binding protein